MRYIIIGCVLSFLFLILPQIIVYSYVRKLNKDKEKEENNKNKEQNEDDDKPVDLKDENK